MKRIYLDNAATSWPKPESVYAATDRYQRSCGAAAGRGVYREAQEAERLVSGTRQRLAQYLGVTNPHEILFACNGTDALNLALHGLLQTGDHVVTSVVEHNSILRPLRRLEDFGVRVTRVGCDTAGQIDLEHYTRALQTPTRLVAVLHASNVTGAVQPIEEMARLAHDQGALVLLDAAQSLGHLDLDWRYLGADLIAGPGHKGLLGPLGTGFLWVHPQIAGQLRPIRQGGTGTDSESDRQPDSWPDRFEAGNLNVPGIVGLGEGLRFLREQGTAAIQDHERTLTQEILEGLATIPHVRYWGPRDVQRRVGVVSFAVDGYDPRELATLLDTSFAIQVRAGFHCAPLLHRALGTDALGGLVRASWGPFSTRDDAAAFIRALQEIAES